MGLLKKTGNGVAVGGLVVAGFFAVVALILVTLAVSVLGWAVVVFYGSMLVHWAFPDLMESLTFVQSLGVGVILAILSMVFGSGGSK